MTVSGSLGSFFTIPKKKEKETDDDEKQKMILELRHKLMLILTICVSVFLTLFFQHVVSFLNLGFFFKPECPAVEDFCHSVLNPLRSPCPEVLLTEINQVSPTA